MLRAKTCVTTIQVPDVYVATIEGEEKLKFRPATQTRLPSFASRGKACRSWVVVATANLFVSVSVVTPTSLTREQRKLLEQLAVVENKDLEDKGLVDKVTATFFG